MGQKYVHFVDQDDADNWAMKLFCQRFDALEMARHTDNMKDRPHILFPVTLSQIKSANNVDTPGVFTLAAWSSEAFKDSFLPRDDPALFEPENIL